MSTPPDRARPLPLSVKGALLLAFVAAAAGCSADRSPAAPQAFQLQCPADTIVSTSSPAGRAVGFFSPISVGGRAPFSVTCAPASAAQFPVGRNTVACSATDAAGNRAQCTFAITVTLNRPDASVIMAFGDSTTEGQNGRTTVFGTRVVDVPNAYPTQLQNLLDAAFPTPRILVLNRGVGGETVEIGLPRLSGLLDTDKPDTLLLLDGYNNLLNSCSFSAGVTSTCLNTINFVASTLGQMIRTGRQKGARHVFLSTLTPPGPVSGSTDRRIAADAIVRLNALLPGIAATEGAGLVDTYASFVGHEAAYVDLDGLHLRPAGYQVIANLFYAAVLTTSR